MLLILLLKELFQCAVEKWENLKSLEFYLTATGRPKKAFEKQTHTLKNQQTVFKKQDLLQAKSQNLLT